MLNLEIKKKLLEDLKRLTFDSQKKVQEFAHALLITQNKGKAGKELASFAGILTPEDSRELKRIIDAECERVDINGW